MKQKAAITFESEETIILKQGSSAVTGFCPVCRTDVELISPEGLALLTGVSERTIFRLIEAGRIHFIERNRVFACSGCYSDSLSEDPGSTVRVLPKIGNDED